jgi:hypothetical protein
MSLLLLLLLAPTPARLCRDPALPAPCDFKDCMFATCLCGRVRCCCADARALLRSASVGRFTAAGFTVTFLKRDQFKAIKPPKVFVLCTHQALVLFRRLRPRSSSACPRLCLPRCAKGTARRGKGKGPCGPKAKATSNYSPHNQRQLCAVRRQRSTFRTQQLTDWQGGTARSSPPPIFNQITHPLRGALVRTGMNW